MPERANLGEGMATRMGIDATWDESTPAYYLFSAIEIHDHDEYARYIAAASQILPDYDLEILSTDSNPVMFRGEPPANRLVLERVRSLDELRRFAGSAEYRAIAHHRENSSSTRFSILMQGILGSDIGAGPAFYLFSAINMTNETGYARYIEAAPAIMRGYGVEALSTDGSPEVLAGRQPGNRLVLVRVKAPEDLASFADDPAYRAIAHHRDDNSSTNFAFLMRGNGEHT